MQHILTLNPICKRGNVTRITLESSANGPVTVTLGKNNSIPVLRNEGQFGQQRADWQMSDNSGSDYATIRCGSQVALVSWVNGRFIQRSGNLPIQIVNASLVAPFRSPEAYTRIA
jgi:hypothetical protein